MKQFIPVFRPLRLICILLGILIMSAGCSSRSEEPDPDPVTPQIIFLFSPGGLGDMSYNDCILEGVQLFKKTHPEIDIFLSSPPDMETAERIYTDWLKRPGSDIPVAFVLASSDYQPLVDRYLEDYTLTENKRILLFESTTRYADSRISTFQISMFGASYLAGAAAGRLCEGRRSLVLLGSSSDLPIRYARDGFIAGLGTSNYDVEYLASDWTGFVMANATYQRMSRWASDYGFIFPVAGGSNAGIYRYTRENPESPLLAGMDIDQSSLSNNITGSVVKLFDRVIQEYFSLWLATGDFPASTVYGLESGFVDWYLSPRYEALLKEVKEANLREAVEKEKNYYEESRNQTP